MTLRMLDSIDVGNLPASADAYLGYADGAWATAAELRGKFPQAHLLTLAVFPQDDAEGLDIENGDATIAEVHDWFTRQQARKVWRPVLYISAASAGDLLATMSANGFARSSFRLLTAHYRAGKHICGPGSCPYPAADGTQWTDSAPGAGGSFIDESLLLDTFFPAPPQPSPVPHPGARTGDTMLYLPTGKGAVLAVPVPTAVLNADGTIAPPSVLRFATNSPVGLEYMLGDSGTWVPLAVDYARSPTEIPLKGAAQVKIQRAGGETTLVTADFA